MTKKAVVTGAASGIGRAVGDVLGARGYQVLRVDRDRAGLERSAGENDQTLVADLASADGLEEVVAAAAGSDALVNAAGIILLKPIIEVTLADLRRLFTVNFDAVWELTSRIGWTMPSGGAIVNLSSSSAKLANTTEAAAYAATKTAILSLTRSFAYAFASSNVRVNAVCPGIIDTPMQDAVLAQVSTERGISAAELSAARNTSVPLGRSASAAECAQVIHFLLSDESSYLTGQAINVTGGLVTW